MIRNSHARRYSQVITKLLYLLNQGERFTNIEATEVFFAVTKLFQSKDTGLRRMVYLIIKELSPSSDEIGPLNKGLNPISIGNLVFTSPYLQHAVRAVSEGIAVGRSLALMKNHHVDGNKEMIAFGLMNIAGSFTSCYLTTGVSLLIHTQELMTYSTLLAFF